MSGTRGAVDLDASINSLLGEDAVDEQESNVQEPSVDNGDNNEPSTDATSEPAKKPAGQDEPSASGSSGVDDKQKQPPQRQVEAVVPRGYYPSNADGDLVDQRTGAIIAKAGNERKYFEAARNANTRTARLENDMQTLQTQLSVYKEATSLPTQLGVDPGEVTQAVRFMAHWKKNPVEAAQKMLTDLRAMGHDLPEATGSAVDTAAIKQMIAEAINPFTADREQQRTQIEARSNAEREVTALEEQYPWVANQYDALNKLMQSGQFANLNEATLRLENWALRNGFDFDRPFDEQYSAMRSGNQPAPMQPAAPAQPPAPVNRAMMPAPNVGNGNAVPRAGNIEAEVTSDYKSIVAQAMRDAGLVINR